MLKAAVIGAGYIAREHLDALRGLPDVLTAGLCDLSATMAEATAEEFGVSAWFTDHHRMLEELRPDVVHITTPPRSHVPLAIDALEAGAHVLVEKPLALDRDDFDKLQSLAQASGLLLIEDYNYLFNPPVQRILELIETGRLGEVVHVDALFCSDILGKGSKHMDPNAPNPFHTLPGGPVADFITHLAYLAHAFIGEHRAVHTSWTNRSGDEMVPWDEFRALVDGERGTASLGFSSHAQPDVFWLRVHGTRMRATASLFEPLLSIEKVYDGPPPLMPLWNGLQAARAYGSSAIGGLWGKLRGVPGTYAGLRVLVERLYGGLSIGAEPPVTLERIQGVNRLVCDLLASAEKT